MLACPISFTQIKCVEITYNLVDIHTRLGDIHARKTKTTAIKPSAMMQPAQSASLKPIIITMTKQHNNVNLPNPFLLRIRYVSMQ